ncbi:MAG: hypothetical protein ACK4WF_03710 [Candidatus Brocadiales bacterium]
MEWNISKGSGQCSSCQHVFLEEEFFFSTLYLETDCLLRKDFCLGCWGGRALAEGPSAVGRSAELTTPASEPNPPKADESATPEKAGHNPGNFFSFWKTRMPKKEEPRRRIVDNAVILNLFSRLQGVTELWAKNMQYVLGLFLLRKKLLKLKEQGKDGQGDFLCLYSPEEDKTYQIYNSNLTEEEVEKINNDVLKLLDPTAGQNVFLFIENATDHPPGTNPSSQQTAVSSMQ